MLQKLLSIHVSLVLDYLKLVLSGLDKLLKILVVSGEFVVGLSVVGVLNLQGPDLVSVLADDIVY